MVAAFSVAVSGSLLAQDPVRLPEVKVSAKVDKPGPRRVVGIVVDTAGNPIEGAEVIIPGLVRRIFTAGDGTFRLDSIGKGNHLMRARKIGYAPQFREVAVDTAGGVIAFALVPITTALPAMVSTASRRGLSGFVGDLALQPVGGATVRVLGVGLHTKTGPDGSFFLPAQPGRYMVSIQKDSFATKLVGVSIPEDSGRHVNAWLQPFHGKLTKAEYWNVEDLRERAAWILPHDRVFFSREDLARLEYEWVYDAVVSTSARFNAQAGMSRSCPVVVNGGPAMAPIGIFTIDDVESVEVMATIPLFSPTTEATKSKSKYSEVKSPLFLPMDARKAMMALKSLDAPKGNVNKPPPACLGVFVWLR
jgi:hypothetical protein